MTIPIWAVLLGPSLTFVGGGAMTFFVQRLLDKHRTADRVATVDRTNALLTEEVTKLKQSLLDQQNKMDAVCAEQAAQIAELTDRLADYEDRERVLERFRFDVRTGTFIGDDGLHYCARCLRENKWPRESPVQSNTGTWVCPVCRCTTYTKS